MTTWTFRIPNDVPHTPCVWGTLTTPPIHFRFTLPSCSGWIISLLNWRDKWIQVHLTSQFCIDFIYIMRKMGKSRRRKMVNICNYRLKWCIQQVVHKIFISLVVHSWYSAGLRYHLLILGSGSGSHTHHLLFFSHTHWHCSWKKLFQPQSDLVYFLAQAVLLIGCPKSWFPGNNKRAWWSDQMIRYSHLHSWCWDVSATRFLRSNHVGSAAVYWVFLRLLTLMNIACTPGGSVCLAFHWQSPGKQFHHRSLRLLLRIHLKLSTLHDRHVDGGMMSSQLGTWNNVPCDGLVNSPGHILCLSHCELEVAEPWDTSGSKAGKMLDGWME